MEYKITKITHSGTKGERGQDRTDGRYPMTDENWKNCRTRFR